MNLKMKPSLNAVYALTVFLPAICSTGLQGKVYRSTGRTDEHLGGPNTHGFGAQTQIPPVPTTARTEHPREEAELPKKVLI